MTPDCPKCDAHQSLQRVGAEVQDQRWFVCYVCSTPVLVKVSDGTILKVGKP